ncbi:MAG TPA: amidohydrolase family protein [Chthoniobacterales bacterium]|jgi:imidazolonepropionase-like amidohydrolase|nr:amidohydrolase family protein [Chthoniobacterales bacterium]
MKRFSILALALLVSSAALATPSGKMVIVNGTAIDPGTSKVIPNAAVVIEDDHITSIVQNSKEMPMKGDGVIDATGKFILPGYIDTHVHFFQSGDIYTRPDGLDLNSIRPYKQEVDWIRSHLDDTFARYLRCGITSVLDIGGPLWNFEMRKQANATLKAPRVAAAGPLISSVSRPQLDLGDPPIVKIDTPEQGREMVRKLAAQKPDYIKIWYIVPPAQPAERITPKPGEGGSPSASSSPTPGQSDADRAAIFRPVVHAVAEESHRLKLRVAVHATELEAARASAEEGADLLVHSVTDKPVDDSFVKLLKEKGTILTPTLVVFERYGRTFANKLELTPEEKAWGNPEVIASLDVTKVPEDKRPERLKKAMENPQPILESIQKTYDIALKNLKTLEDAGITIATGTDAGNIGTIHGPAIFREFQLMKQAGLTPMQILQCTTANAAKTFGGDTGAKIGSLKPGNFADLVILKSNPLDDIKNASDIDSVVKNGVIYQADSILPK